MNRHSSLTSSYHIFLFPDFFSLMTWLNVEFNLIFQIFDRLCQNFGGDVLETLFYSAETLANCSEENRSSCTWKFFYDLALATASSNILFVAVLFSFCCLHILFSQLGSLTLSTLSFFYFISSGNYFIDLYCCSQ